MNDLIEKLSNLRSQYNCFDENERDAYNTLSEAIKVLSKRKTGKWIVDMKRFGDDAYHCDQCGAILEEDALNWRNNYFCYHCGAEMDGSE